MTGISLRKSGLWLTTRLILKPDCYGNMDPQGMQTAQISIYFTTASLLQLVFKCGICIRVSGSDSISGKYVLGKFVSCSSLTPARFSQSLFIANKLMSGSCEHKHVKNSTSIVDHHVPKDLTNDAEAKETFEAPWSLKKS